MKKLIFSPYCLLSNMFCFEKHLYLLFLKNQAATHKYTCECFRVTFNNIPVNWVSSTSDWPKCESHLTLILFLGMCHSSRGGFVWLGFFPPVFLTVSVVLKDSQIRPVEVHLTLERSGTMGAPSMLNSGCSSDANVGRAKVTVVKIGGLCSCAGAETSVWFRCFYLLRLLIICLFSPAPVDEA